MKVQAVPEKVEHSPVQPGEHILTLTDVFPVESDNFYGKQKDPNAPDTKTRWCWRFLSDTIDEEGKQFEYVHRTGTYYGDDRAELTRLLDFLMPGAPAEQKRTVDTDTLIGKRYRVAIKPRVNKKGATVPSAMYFIPATAAQSTGGGFDPDEIPF